MPFPQVVGIAAGSAAEAGGVQIGDEIRSLQGVVPRDVIEFTLLAEEPVVDLEIGRGGLDLELRIDKVPGAPLGVEVSSPLFDRVRTCDNHSAFCFIYQLPKGLRRSLYVKDDDYRLSFLYGNFTTLTRFTELDVERVVSERLSPLYVSIHATDPTVRAAMLRNRRGATSLRWLRALLDHDIEVHGQIVCCPGVNDQAVLEDTFATLLERYAELASVAVVPLGVSRYTTEEGLRPHTPAEAAAVLETVTAWQRRFRAVVGRRVVHAADEYYLLAGVPLPPARVYEAEAQQENGIGMARAFVEAFRHATPRRHAARSGFFASLEAAPHYGYHAARVVGSVRGEPVVGPTTVLTSTYGAAVLRPLLEETGYGATEVVAVANDYFGGNIGVAGLLTGTDVGRALESVPARRRVLLPDVCLSSGQFLDGIGLGELSRPVEVVPSDGASLRRALDATRSIVSEPAPVGAVAS